MGGGILLFGGKSGYGGRVLRFDPDSRVIEVTADRMPRDVVRPALVDAGEAILLFGGVDRDPVDQILRYDAIRPEGERLVLDGESLPLPNHSMAAYWDRREGVAVLLGGVGAPHEVLRFDPWAPAGSRCEFVATLPVEVVDSAVSFEGDLPLPVLVGSSIEGFGDAISVMTWIGR